MEENLVNYAEESEKLDQHKTGNDYWNPKEGKFEVTALSELIKFNQPDKDGTIKEKAKILVMVAGQQLTWTMGVGQTKASLYGQLVSKASENNGTLVNLKFTVVIKNDGTKRDFTIV